MKILVVDDEPLIAQFIVGIIKKASPDNEILGYVTSGEKALDSLSRQFIDLVFADITMPRMDGLQLLSEIKNKSPFTEVVMLTSHESFDYARISMQNQAFDYLLKTELSPKLIADVIAKIDERRGERHTRIIELQTVRNSFLNKITTNSPDAEPITKDELRSNQIYIDNKPFIAALFIAYQGKLNHLAIDADSLFLNPFLYKKGDNKVYFLSNVKSGNSDEILSNLKKMSAGACGFSKVHCDIAEIREALSEAAADLSCRFYNSSLTQKQEEDLMLNDFYLSIINIHIKENRISSACIDLQNYLEKAAEVKFAAETVYDLCNEVLSKLQTTVNPIEQYSPETLYRSDGYENLCNYVFSLIRQIRNAHTTYTKSIQKALDYIDEHFAEDISLNSVADHVYLHRDYLSRQFKKEVGINFVDYLMNVRLNRAKTLLESTGMRVSDIAVQVGIPNLSYFSTVFSRKFGVSPNAVRSHRITNF